MRHPFEWRSEGKDVTLAPVALGKDEPGRNETPALQGSGLWAHLPVFPAGPVPVSRVRKI